MFSTPLIFCSSGVATAVSTSVAPAPTNVVVTCTIGGTVSGYCAIGRPNIATVPSITITIDSTIATIGRLMKKRAMGLFVLFDGKWFCGAAAGFRRWRVLGRDDGARFQPLRAFNDHTVRWLQPFVDDPQRSHTRADVHCLDGELVVGSNNRHVVETLQLLHGSLRYEHGVLSRFEDEADAPVLAWSNQA